MASQNDLFLFFRFFVMRTVYIFVIALYLVPESWCSSTKEIALRVASVVISARYYVRRTHVVVLYMYIHGPWRLKKSGVEFIDFQ
jgi:hypothetical protein